MVRIISEAIGRIQALGIERKKIKHSPLKTPTIKLYVPDKNKFITGLTVETEGYNFTYETWKEWLHVNVRGLKGDTLTNAATLMVAFTKGAKHIESITKGEREKPDFKLPNIIFTFNNNDDVFDPVVYDDGSKSILIQVNMLKTFAAKTQAQILHLDNNGSPVFTGSRKQLMLLAGIEESDHAAHHLYVGESPSIRIKDVSSLAEYDAHPIELRALLEQKRYVESHPEEFEQEELEIINKRITNAIAFPKTLPFAS